MSGKIQATQWSNSKRVWEEAKKTLLTSPRREFVIYDLETTGLSKTEDRAIEVGAIRVAYNDTLDEFKEIGSLHVYIKPDKPLDPKITEITGLTDQYLEEHGVSEEDAFFDEIQEFFMDDIVIGYNNANFDNAFMKNMYERYGSTFAPVGVVDVLVLARKALKKGVDVENHKLVTVGKYFGIDFEAHTATEDARATGEIFKIFVAEFKEKEAEASKKPAVELRRPKLLSINFWEGYRGFSRIYVNTSIGKIYYDIRGGVWAATDFDIESLDMEYLEPLIFKEAGCKTEREFAKFRMQLKIA